MTEAETPATAADTPPADAPRAADTPPDRLSLDPASPHFDAAILRRGIGIRFKGVERTTVEEYSVSEGWVRMAVGKSRDRRGNPMTVKLMGPVEPYFLDIAADSAS